MKILEQYKISFYTNILPRYYKKYFRWILKIRTKSHLLLYLYVHTLVIDKFKNEKLSIRRNISNYLIDKLYALKDEILDIPEELQDYKNEIVELEQKLYDDDRANKFFSNIDLITSYYYSYGNLDSKLSDEHFQKAILISSKNVAFNKESFAKHAILVSNEVKKYTQHIKNISIQTIKDDVEESIVKIDIDSKKVTFLISLLTTLFIASGFIYNKFYLGYFNIEVTDFFSISDYLSSSIDKIMLALIPTTFALILYIYSLYRAYHIFIEAEQNDTEYKPDDKSLLTITIVCTFLLLITTYTSNEIPTSLLSVNILIALFSFLEIIKLHKFINNVIQVHIVILTLFIFFANLYSKVETDIKNIEDEDFKQEYIFTFENKLGLEEDNLRFLGSSTNYYFFYCLKTKSSIIINRNEVKKIISK